jgi:integrase
VPYKIPGFGGTFYAPSERKANRWVVWRGRDDSGTKLEIATDARDPAGAKAYVNKHLAERARRRPPAAGTPSVTVAIVSAHYKATRGLDETHADWRRLAFIEGRDGKLEVRGINNAVIKATAEAWLTKRRGGVTLVNAELVAKGKRPRHRVPTFAAANREVITPYRALLKFAAEQDWRAEIVVRSLRAPEGSLPPDPPRIADDATVFALLDAIEEKIRTAPTPWSRQKHLEKRAFVWLCHERGYRIGEWLRFDWEWVDLPGARGRMAITKNKNDLRWEEFEFSPTAVAYLAPLGPRTAGKVFPWHSRSNVYRWADQLIGPNKKWRPHESRRAIVSDIVARTGDYKQAGKYVGHSSEKTTFRYRILRRPDLAPDVRFGPKKVG